MNGTMRVKISESSQVNEKSAVKISAQIMYMEKFTGKIRLTQTPRNTEVGPGAAE
jgi:hypothetical protein